MSNEIEKVVIIGSGCAGLTAALYTARAQLKPVVLTGAMPGGLLTTTSIVENFPGWPEGIDGTDLMIKLQQQAERFGAEVRFGSTVESVNLSERPFKLTVDGEPMLAQTLIVASGAGHRHLGLESEKKLDKKASPTALPAMARYRCSAINRLSSSAAAIQHAKRPHT